MERAGGDVVSVKKAARTAWGEDFVDEATRGGGAGAAAADEATGRPRGSSPHRIRLLGQPWRMLSRKRPRGRGGAEVQTAVADKVTERPRGASLSWTSLARRRERKQDPPP